jgi:hypothetical protein
VNGIEACFVGRLGRDAELRMVKGGELPLVSFSAAVEEKVQAADAPPQWVRVGRQRPRPTRNAQRGAQTWHRARYVGQRKAQQAGEDLLRAAPPESSRRRDNPEPPAAWVDDTDLAVADLEGRGR